MWVFGGLRSAFLTPAPAFGSLPDSVPVTSLLSTRPGVPCEAGPSGAASRGWSSTHSFVLLRRAGPHLVSGSCAPGRQPLARSTRCLLAPPTYAPCVAPASWSGAALTVSRINIGQIVGFSKFRACFSRCGGRYSSLPVHFLRRFAVPRATLQCLAGPLRRTCGGAVIAPRRASAPVGRLREFRPNGARRAPVPCRRTSGAAA